MKVRLTRATLRTSLLVIGAVVICLTTQLVALATVDNEKTRNRAERALRAGDFERAEQIYRELLAKDDHDTDARLGLSRALLKQRRLQDSFDHAARVIALDPLSA